MAGLGSSEPSGSLEGIFARILRARWIIIAIYALLLGPAVHFAILVMFAVTRATGMPLNVATILIASTVLGTSENEEIHFFYHFQEGRGGGTVEQALRHTLTVSGRAIFLATLINAGGFLAFAVSPLLALRQFGTLAAVAFVLSMLADFTAPPKALWILSRERPEGLAPGPR
jgi:hypothetical protein